MDKPAPDLKGQSGSSSEDEEINSLVTKLMTNLKVAEAQDENFKSFNSTDFRLSKIVKCRFCDVLNYRDMTTKKNVVVKMFKKTCKKEDIDREVSMLEEIILRNPSSKFNIKFLKRFVHNGRTCLLFERLQRNIIMSGQGSGLLLRCIRIIAIQLFLALDELKAVNILHANIHPENIMYVNMEKQPFQLKLIDFGFAIKASDAQPGMELQTLEYRAPEIFLGLPFTEAIDVWGVGCILAYLCLGHNLFSASSEDQMVERIVELLGQPEDHLLHSGKYTERYFMKDKAADGPTWRLRKPVEESSSTEELSLLDVLIKTKIKNCDNEYEDGMAFVDLLKQLLHLDPNHRISARQALKHPFITMDHLINNIDPDGYYLEDSQYRLEECSVLSEYLEDKSANWTPFQEFPVVTTTHWDQEGRIILHGSSSSYSFLEKIGQGVTNYIVRCQNNTTKEEVAVRIPQLDCEDDKPTEPEVCIMRNINAWFPDSIYTIKLFDQCEYRGRTCLVFEILDRSLKDEIEEHGTMSLRSIRPIAKQLFLAFDELKTLKIKHSDIHEGHVMFVNKQDQPHRIKLINFGMASKVNDFDEAIDESIYEAMDNAMYEDDDEYVDQPFYMHNDMADVGWILAFLYVGYRVFADKFDIESELGLPAEESESEEYEELETISQMSENNSTGQPSWLEDVVHENSTDRDAEPEDLMADGELEERIAFADLLRQIMDDDKRIPPCQALQHPFITMDHLINRFETRNYLDASQAIMNECPIFSTNTVKSSSGCTPDQKSFGSFDSVFTSDVSASSGGPRKLLQRIHRFFHRVKKSDRKIPTVQDKDNSEVCVSGGGLHQSISDEYVTARSSAGAIPTDLTPNVSASSGGLRKFWKRISRVKNYLCCCLPHNVEE